MISRRLILLLTAGLVIAGLVVFRERQLADWKRSGATSRAAPRRLAPRFQVVDHRRHVVKFERYLGRQRIVLLFFDAKAGAAHDPHVQLLARHFDKLRQAGIEVIAISDSTPYANLEAEKERGSDFPFPLLTDIDLNVPATSPVHRMYGLYDPRQEVSLNGLFLIDRDGTLPVGPDGKPLQVQNVEETLQLLCEGKWPSSQVSLRVKQKEEEPAAGSKL